MFVRARHEVGGQTVLTQKKTDPRLGSVVWSVGDSNSRPLPCEGSALNQLS